MNRCGCNDGYLWDCWCWILLSIRFLPYVRRSSIRSLRAPPLLFSPLLSTDFRSMDCCSIDASRSFFFVLENLGREVEYGEEYVTCSGISNLLPDQRYPRTKNLPITRRRGRRLGRRGGFFSCSSLGGKEEGRRDGPAETLP